MQYHPFVKKLTETIYGHRRINVCSWFLMHRIINEKTFLIYKFYIYFGYQL
jgi:hypothetical protein